MKKLMLFSMWLVASAAAVGVAWAGVSVVDGQVVDPPSVAELASSPIGGASSADDGSQDDTPTSVDESIATSTASGNVSSLSTEGLPATQSTTQTTPAPMNPPSSTALPTIPPPTTAPPTTAPPTTVAAATTQTFALTGGTAAISFSASGVQVLWATPNPGFSVEIEPESPGIKVEFRAEHHRSRIDAWWSGGPQRSIREEQREDQANDQYDDDDDDDDDEDEDDDD